MKKTSRILLLLSASLILASCVAPPHAPPPKEPVPPEAPPAAAATQLEGVWREVMNENAPVSVNKTWTFSGNRITIRDEKDTYEGTFTVNDESEPKQIDIQFEAHPLNKGIYRIGGEMLTVKVLDSQVERAKDFGVEPGYTSIMCKRVREEENSRK